MTAKIGFIGRGTYYKEIHKHLKEQGIDSCNAMRYISEGKDIIVNYGLYGDKFREWFDHSLYAGTSYMQSTMVLNRGMFGNKLECCEAVRAAGVPVPECASVVGEIFNEYGEFEVDGWIVKPLISFGGRGIVPYTGQAVTSRQYLQERIINRRYELRVHAVKWLPVEEWLVSKRTHPDGEAQLTWNHHQGGSFSNIEMNESNTGVFKRAKYYAKRVIDTLGYDFSAVDFIVQNGRGELPIWFIEANLAPGFSTDRTREFYFNAFLKFAQQGAPVLSIPPPVPVQETPVPTAPRIISNQQKNAIAEHLVRENLISNVQLIEFINNLR
jgi:hypothetical protein